MILDGHIELCSGRKFDFKLPWAWDIDEIAHSLSNQCRFTGHSRKFYSVAEHSVLCSLLAEETGLCDPFEALMHDAHESILSDMAKPWKQHIAGFDAWEAGLEKDLRAHFGLPEETTPGCKRIDYMAVFIEAKFLMKSKAEDWVDPLGVRPQAYSLVAQGWHPGCLEPGQAKNAFLLAYRDLETVPSEVSGGRQKARS